MKIPREANTLRDGFGIDYRAAAEAVASFKEGNACGLRFLTIKQKKK